MSTTPAPATTDLGWTLSVVLRAFVKAANAATADLPGGPRGFQVLATVAREEPGSQSALAHRLGIDRTVLTYLLDDLARAGLVERRPDPLDRRNRRVVATPLGQQLAVELDRRLRHAEDHLLGGLDGAERTTLRGLLERVASYANDLDPIASACDAIEDIAAAKRSAI
jgi:DNA-binding MarR family transcriptional regulator